MNQSNFLKIADANTNMLAHIRVATLCLSETRSICPGLKNKYFMAEIKAVIDGLRAAESPMLDPVIQNKYWLPALRTLQITYDLKWSQRELRVEYINHAIGELERYRSELMTSNKKIFSGEALNEHLRNEERRAQEENDFKVILDKIASDRRERINTGAAFAEPPKTLLERLFAWLAK